LDAAVRGWRPNVDLLAIRSATLIERLRWLGYDNRSSSNRFDRDTDGSTATIDILVPSYSSRHVPNLDAGEITVDGIPMLHAALARPAVVLDVMVDLTDARRPRPPGPGSRRSERDRAEGGRICGTVRSPRRRRLAAAARALSQATPSTQAQARMRAITRSLVGR
jgi:hypothetical protein